MVYLTRKEHFNAAHRLYHDAWTEEKNAAVFGKCANKNFHGHNYNLYITIKGEPSAETGFVIDAKQLSRIIQESVLSVFDHRNLNLDTPYFQTMQPSTENFCRVIWNILEPKIPQGVLHCVRLQETENIYAEYFGEK